MRHAPFSTDENSAVEINLFGGFAVRIDDETRPRPPPRVRQLLAIGAVTELSIDAAIDQLWPDTLPANPRRAFQVIVSRCRSTLDTHRANLDIDDGVVRLRAACDVVRYRRMLTDVVVADSDQDGGDQRLTKFDTAVALRAGRAIDTCDHVPVLVAIQSELDLLARDAAIEAAPLLIANGQARAAVQLLDPIWRASPHDEAAGLALANAMAQNSERSRALEVLDRTRAALRDEHGVNLGAAAEELLYELLRGGDGFEPTRPYATLQPTNPVVGMGRILAGMAIDESAVNVIEGYAGDGKSTAAAEILGRWRRQGYAPTRVEAPEHPTRPMQVVAEIVHDLLERGTLDASALDEQTAAAVRRLVSDLPGRSINYAVTREALISLLAKLISVTLDTNRGALLVDDLQFCDSASIEVLRGIIDAAHHPIVLTTRVARPAFVSGLVTHPRCRTVRLNGLERHEVGELAQRCLPGRRVDVDSLFDRSGGHPLFVSLLIGLLIDGDVGEDLPSTALLAVRHRTATLSRRANEALSLLSLFPNGMSLDVLQEIRPTIATELTELAAANLLLPGSDPRIRHAIVREAVNQLIPQGTLVAWHDQIGWLLERHGFPASSWVDHALAAAQFDPHRAMAAALMAATEHANAFAWERVLDLATQALGIAARFELHDDVSAARAHLWAGRAELALSMADDGDAALLAAVELAETIGDDELLAEAVIELCSFGRISPTDTLGDELHARIERLLDADLPPRLRCELAAAAGTLLSVSRLQQHGRDLFMQGYRDAKRLGDVEVERRVLVHLHLALGHPSDLDTRIEGAKRLGEIAGNDPDLVWEARYLDFGIGLITADRDLIDKSIVDLREFAPRLRLRDRSFGLAFTEASYAKVLGDLELAEALTAKAAEIGRQRFPEKWVTYVVTAIFAAVTEARGQLGTLMPFAESRMAANPQFPLWHAIAAVAAADLGDDARVRVELDHLRRSNFELVPDLSWSALASLLASPVALANDLEAASILSGVLTPFSGQMAWNGMTTHHPIDHYLAIYDAVTGSGRSAEYRERAAALTTALTSAPAVTAPAS